MSKFENIQPLSKGRGLSKIGLNDLLFSKVP